MCNLCLHCVPRLAEQSIIYKVLYISCVCLFINSSDKSGNSVIIYSPSDLSKALSLDTKGKIPRSLFYMQFYWMDTGAFKLQKGHKGKS